MSFFQKLSGQINEIGKKSKEVLETTNLKNKKRQLENKKDEKFKELGMEVYDAFNNKNPNDSTAIDICNEITEIEAEIKKIEEEIEKITPVEIFCTSCGTKTLSNVKFCSQCGTKIAKNEESEQDQDIKETSNEEEINT